MSGPCQGAYVISAWHILIAGSRTFFSFVQNRRKLQVSCSAHNPRGCLPSPGCVCAVSTRGLKSKPAPGSEKHPQKVTRSGLPCLNFQPGGVLMPVSLMLCIILLSALPGAGGGCQGEFVVESKLHCSNPFFPLLCVPVIGHLIIVNPQRLMD